MGRARYSNSNRKHENDKMWKGLVQGFILKLKRSINTVVPQKSKVKKTFTKQVW